jgi:hypothetical protein
MQLIPSRISRFVIIVAIVVGVRPATAQQPPALAGHYLACFTGADTARAACGTLTLAPTTSCPPAGDVSPVYDGYYSVLFSALRLRDSTRSRPANEQRFTWQAKPDGSVRFTRISFISDSLLGGETRCRISSDSDFEAWGMVAGDGIAGKWGNHIDWVGPDTLGTFVLRRMPR